MTKLIVTTAAVLAMAAAGVLGLSTPQSPLAEQVAEQTAECACCDCGDACACETCACCDCGEDCACGSCCDTGGCEAEAATACVCDGCGCDTCDGDCTDCGDCCGDSAPKTVQASCCGG